MKREIKFRGKIDCTEEEGWVYGNLINGKIPYIVGEVIDSFHEGVNLEYWYPVNKNTIGQYTGFKDKNEKEMYEGDIVNLASEKTEPFMRNIPLVVRRYVDGQFVLVDRLGCRDFLITNIVEVIGNIHDNPELLETKGD